MRESVCERGGEKEKERERERVRERERERNEGNHIYSRKKIEHHKVHISHFQRYHFKVIT